MPEYAFPGLVEGDRWCLVALRWKQALAAGMAPDVVLEATHESVLEIVSLEDLQAHAMTSLRELVVVEGDVHLGKGTYANGDHFRHLFEYDDWANRRTLDALRNQTSERSRQILAPHTDPKQEYFERLRAKIRPLQFLARPQRRRVRTVTDITTDNYKRLLDDADESLHRPNGGVQDKRRSAVREYVSRAACTRPVSLVDPIAATLSMKMREAGLNRPRSTTFFSFARGRSELLRVFVYSVVRPPAK
jgi:hypothetical protein